MNKKALLPLLSLAIIPFLIIGVPYNDADKIGKQFAIDNPGVTIAVYTLEEDITEKEEIKRSQLIIEGTVIETKPYWKIIYSDSIPRIFTEFTIKVDDVLKGNLNDKTIKVVMQGASEAKLFVNGSVNTRIVARQTIKKEGANPIYSIFSLCLRLCCQIYHLVC